MGTDSGVTDTQNLDYCNPPTHAQRVNELLEALLFPQPFDLPSAIADGAPHKLNLITDDLLSVKLLVLTS